MDTRDPHLAPPAAAYDGAAHPDDRLVRELGFSDTTLLLVSSVIGAGIFLTPGVVAETVPDPTLFLLAWLVGGCISLAGALGNAELGAMFPRAGGDYVYLREAFHPAAGFLVGWLSFFVIYAGTVAALATGFADGVERLLPLGSAGKIALAIAVTLATTWVNWVGIRTGASFNNVTAVLKIGTLALLVAVGWLLAPAPSTTPPLEGTSPEGSAVTAGGFALAMSPILFSYLGWNAPVYVASEIREPGTTIPRSLFVGLGICTALYLAMNALYVRTLPLEHLIGASDAGEAAARSLFGGVGGIVAAILILLSVLGCLNATILVGPRIAYAMALDGHFFPGAERVHDHYRTPHVALAAQAAFSIALILLLRRFPSVLDYTTFAIVLATMADIAALYALRVRQPARPRPYRAWGYPLVPALYFVANGAIAIALLRGRPLECLIALLVAASGLPFLWVFSRMRASRVR
ncbi:MAG: amino acid permease [Deltaproteobacteria bacterium]|nr:amino acid permease [Deltaproteobacteria bacterium]